MILALFIISIASVSASDVSDINDNQDYISVGEESVDDNLLSNYDNDDLSFIDGNSNPTDDSNSQFNSDIISSESEDEGAGDSGSLVSGESDAIVSNPKPTNIVSSTTKILSGDVFSVTLKDGDGTPLSGKRLIFTINGKDYARTTNSNGVAGLTIKGTVAKTYKLTYMFAGDEDYAASSGTVNITIKMPTTVTGSGSTIVKGSNFLVTLKNANGNVLSNKTLTFNFSGRIYTKKTNSKGVASLTINPTPGKSYNLTYTYAGSSYYGGSSQTVSLFVKTPTQFTNSGNSVGQGKSYYITLKDADGKVLANKSVKITFNGKIYDKTTNSKGVAGLKISGPIGNTYSFSYKFAGDKNYGPSSGSINVRIKKATSLTGPSSNVIIKGNAYKVTLKDNDGLVLAGQKITFTFSGKVYDRTTNSKGVASLTISAAAGKTYKLSYKYAGTSYYNGSTSGNINLAVKVKSTFKNSGSVIMNNTTYNVTLKDTDGNPLANKLVNFTFGGISYQNTTDANGTVGILIIVNAPKTAKLTYMFEGDTKYEASSGSVNLDVKSDKIFRFKDIVNASIWLRDYVEKNHKLPSTISVNGVKVNMTVFAYLLGQSVVNINKNKTYNVAVIDVNSTYGNSGNSSLYGDLNKDKYIDLSSRLVNFIEVHGRLPYYITTDIGRVSPNLYIFGLSKVLAFYSNMNRLPNYVTLNAKDLGGNSSVTKKGNASQYKKGLNEVQALNSTELAKYLQSSGNDALNAAIRELANNLTKGKSTTWAKAEAIFNWVRDNVQYEYYANTKYKATGTLSKKRGNCCDHANLIVALCRAADIPARYSHGKNCKFSSGLNTGHVWAQIYVDGVWYSADATSSRNKLGNIQNWNTNSFTLQEYALVHLSF